MGFSDRQLSDKQIMTVYIHGIRQPLGAQPGGSGKRNLIFWMCEIVFCCFLRVGRLGCLRQVTVWYNGHHKQILYLVLSQIVL
jgi:hypothetical protein